MLSRCAGDGSAGLLGTKFGGKKLFWNSQKTFVGTISFIFFSYLSVILFMELYKQQKWQNSENLGTYYHYIPVIVIFCGILESISIFGEWDNFVVFLGSVIIHKLLGF
jgi:dolichol kinase